jgi:hypothetical protein
MFQNHGQWVVFVAGAVLVAGLTAVALALAPVLPFSHQAARARWQQQEIHRYRIEVRAHNPWLTRHALLEVDHERLVSGVDLATGRPLDPDDLRSLSDLFPVNRMFYRIEKIMIWPATWRRQVIRVAPWLRMWLDPCAAPPAIIRYDLGLGYPIEIRESGSPCISQHGFHAVIERFVVHRS